MLKAVIFDMDGVLVDSEGYYLELFSDMIRRYGGEPDEAVLHTIPGASGDKTWEIIATMWPEPAEAGELRALFHELYPDYCPPYRELLFPGVATTLQALREAGYELALASSTGMPFIRVMLEQNRLSEYFTAVVSGHEFPESKPNPQIYLHTAARLGYDPGACVAVEDSPYGIRAGKNAGMQVIAKRDERFAFDQSEADLVIDDIRQLPEALQRLAL